MKKPWEHPECRKQTVFRREVWSVLLEQNWFFKKRVFIYQSQTPSLSHFLPVPLATISHVYESACVLYIDSFVPHVSDTIWYLSFSKKKAKKVHVFIVSSETDEQNSGEKKKKKLKEDVPIEMGWERNFLSQRLRTQNLRTRIWVGEVGAPYLIAFRGRTKNEEDVVTRPETGFLP